MWQFVRLAMYNVFFAGLGALLIGIVFGDADVGPAGGVAVGLLIGWGLRHLPPFDRIIGRFIGDQHPDNPD